MKLINLLPKKRQQELYYEALLRGLWVIIVFSIFSFAVVFLVQLGTRFYLQMETGVIKKEISDLQSQVDKQENAELKTKIKAINSSVTDYNNLVSSSPRWSKVIRAFVVLPPEGVRIATLQADPSKKTVTVTGHADTREQVIQFYNNILNDSQNFSNVDYPLENVAKPTDINFHFTFSIQDPLIQ